MRKLPHITQTHFGSLPVRSTQTGGFAGLGSIERLRIMQALFGLLLAVVMQVLLSSGRADLPQMEGNSLFALISDDTRKVISCAMMNKVDAYFHGGVKAESCSIENETDHILQGDDEHRCDEHCDHAKESITGFHPVVWINANIHAQEHRHLAEARSVEMLPWVVAASRTSPHNIQSYQIGSYILNRMTEKPQVAIDFLKNGIKNNPDNPELEVSVAEIYYNTLHNMETAAGHFELALIKSLALTREPSTDEMFLRLKIYFYLGLFAKESGDVSKLRDIHNKSLKLNRENTVTQSLATWLEEEESRKGE